MTSRIHPAAPLDGEGYPIHPERGHHICGRKKSDSTTPTEHGRERDDVPFCLLAAGHGTTEPKRTGEPGVACDHHGGDSPKGEANGNYEHGAYSTFPEYVRGTLSPEKQAVFDDLDLEADGELFVEDVVKEAYLKYHTSQDPRFLTEARQWAEKFGVIETAPEKREVEHSGQIDGERTHELDGDTKELALEVIRQRQQQEATDE